MTLTRSIADRLLRLLQVYLPGSWRVHPQALEARRNDKTKEYDMIFRFKPARQRPSLRPLDRDWTNGWSLRDLADLPVHHPRRDDR